MVENQRDAFVGIVAFARKKSLPVSVCTFDAASKIELIPLRVAFEKPSVGRGNLGRELPLVFGDLTQSGLLAQAGVQTGQLDEAVSRMRSAAGDAE